MNAKNTKNARWEKFKETVCTTFSANLIFGISLHRLYSILFTSWLINDISVLQLSGKFFWINSRASSESTSLLNNSLTVLSADNGFLILDWAEQSAFCTISFSLRYVVVSAVKYDNISSSWLLSNTVIAKYSCTNFWSSLRLSFDGVCSKALNKLSNLDVSVDNTINKTMSLRHYFLQKANNVEFWTKKKINWNTWSFLLCMQLIKKENFSRVTSSHHRHFTRVDTHDFI